MGRIIRAATAADLAAVEQIVRAAYSHYIARIGREPGPMLDDYAALIRDGRVSVAEEGGSVSGLLVLVPEARAMLLDNIAVAPQAQGLGIGRALMTFAEKTARDSGYAEIRLYTNAAMTENIALYARWGFAETGRRTEHGFPRVFMRKALAGGPESAG